MAIIHIVLFTWNSTASTEQVEQEGMTHGFVVEFESVEDRDYYINKDPEHQAFVQFVGPLAQDVKVVDYTPGQF